ncbi:MAG: peptidoglycan DD-metalloendopeptidase family protein [Patescibacteria group bacterium]
MAIKSLKLTGKKLGLLAIVIVFLAGGNFVLAQTTNDEETISVDDLQDQIDTRESEIDRINKRIDEYREKLSEYTSETANLLNDISMIENQIAIAQLDVDMTQIEIEQQQLEVQVLDEKIKQESQQLSSQRTMLQEMIFTLHRRSRIGLLEIVFGSDNFSELFVELDQLESVNADLNSALAATKLSKESLESNKVKQEERVDDLIDLELELGNRVVTMEHQINAKNRLVEETQASESQYRVLMSELRQERQYITSQINQIQSNIQERLTQVDEDGGDLGDPSMMSWPMDGVITAVFHDPTYPWRHLWEHSGLDIAAPTGTPIKAAAPGIVAWTKTGANSYGNYIMLIHDDGYATLYGHMSRFAVSADEFVARGQVIGYCGSTGFSTGPHLHFEVRINGIPVNPQNYLID